MFSFSLFVKMDNENHNPKPNKSHFSFMDRTKTVSVIRKRLQTLGCPFHNEENILCTHYLSYSFLAKQMIVNIVCWIEDQCIRLYVASKEF